VLGVVGLAGRRARSGAGWRLAIVEELPVLGLAGSPMRRCRGAAGARLWRACSIRCGLAPVVEELPGGRPGMWLPSSAGTCRPRERYPTAAALCGGGLGPKLPIDQPLT
jgi:hypothetical protein